MESILNQTGESGGGMIEIPSAVYTARYGYEWTELPSWIAKAEADEWHKEINRLRESGGHELKDDEAFEGVLYRRGKEYAVAFRIFCAKKWDQANRDASYCACAFVKCEHFGEIDFGRLLKHAHFIKPSRNPEARIECGIERFEATEKELVENLASKFVQVGEVHLLDEEWRLIGFLLSEYGDGNEYYYFLRKVLGHETISEAKFGKWNPDWIQGVTDDTSESPIESKVEDSKPETNVVVSSNIPGTSFSAEQLGRTNTGSFDTEEDNRDWIELKNKICRVEHRVSTYETEKLKLENIREQNARLHSETLGLRSEVGGIKSKLNCHEGKFIILERLKDEIGFLKCMTFGMVIITVLTIIGLICAVCICQKNMDKRVQHITKLVNGPGKADTTLTKNKATSVEQQGTPKMTNNAPDTVSGQAESSKEQGK